MKEIKILIRHDEKTNKFGFAIDGHQNPSSAEVLKVIGLLEVLKSRELLRLNGKSTMRSIDNGGR